MNDVKFHKSSPHLPVKDLRKTLDYYRDVLGFSEDWTFGDRDGGIRRDEMRLLFEENPTYVTTINNEGNRLSLMWFVNDIDSINEEFRSKRIPIASPLQEYDHGLRKFAFLDINGYYIRITEGVSK